MAYSPVEPQKTLGGGVLLVGELGVGEILKRAGDGRSGGLAITNFLQRLDRARRGFIGDRSSTLMLPVKSD